MTDPKPKAKAKDILDPLQGMIGNIIIQPRREDRVEFTPPSTADNPKVILGPGSTDRGAGSDTFRGFGPARKKKAEI